MSYTRGKVFNVSMNEADKLLLETLAKRHKLTQKVIVGTLVKMCDKYNLMAGEWESRLVADEEKEEKQGDYTRQDATCEAFVFGDKMHFCVWGQEGKPPLIKKLAKNEVEALDMCAKCVKTLELKDKLVTLEMKLAKGMVYDIPSCKMGGQLSTDGKKLYCKDPKKAAQYRDVNKFCKVVNRGANCEYLTWTKIAVKGKKPDLDDKSR